MNWGYKILLVYIVFITGILILVFMSFGQKTDLVTADYYEQELRFQQTIDETVRANALSSQLKYEVRENEMVINFPEEMKDVKLSANILLYCIADKNKDIQNEISTTDGAVHFFIPPANKGLHELKVTWKVNGLGYYYQHKILLK